MRTDLVAELFPEDIAMSYGYFTDDDLSIRIRRAGYKLINAKDTFIHHYGSASYSKIGADKMALMEDHMVRKHGFSTWGSNLASMDIPNFFECNGAKGKSYRILCVDDSLASTGLFIKNKLNFNGATEVKLYGVLQNSLYLPYVESTYEKCAVYDGEDTIRELCTDKVDFAIIPNLGEVGSSYMHLLKQIKEVLKDRGKIYLTISNPSYINNIFSSINGGNSLFSWASANNISSRTCFFNIDTLTKELHENDFRVSRICNITDYSCNLKSIDTILDLSENMSDEVRKILHEKTRIARHVMVIP